MGRQRLLLVFIVLSVIALGTSITEPCQTAAHCDGFQCLGGTCSDSICAPTYTICGNTCNSGEGICCSQTWRANGKCCDDSTCAYLGTTCKKGVCSNYVCTTQNKPEGTKVEGNVCCGGEVFGGTCCSAGDCSDGKACTADLCTNHACDNPDYDIGYNPSSGKICCGSPRVERTGNCCADGDCVDPYVCTQDKCENYVCSNDNKPDNSILEETFDGQAFKGVCCEGVLYSGNDRDCCSDDAVAGDHACLDHKNVPLVYFCDPWQEASGHSCSNKASFTCGSQASYSQSGGCVCQENYHLQDISWISGCAGQYIAADFAVPFEMTTFTEGTTNCDDIGVFPSGQESADPGETWKPGYRFQKACDIGDGADGDHQEGHITGTTMDMRFRAGIEMVTSLIYRIHIYKLDSHVDSGFAETGFCIRPKDSYKFIADNPASSIDNIKGIESISDDGTTCFYAIDHNTPAFQDTVVTVRLAMAGTSPVADIVNPFAVSSVGPYWLEVKCFDETDGNADVRLVSGKQPRLVTSGGAEAEQAWDDAPASEGTEDEDIKFRIKTWPHEEIEGKLLFEMTPISRRPGTNNVSCSVCITPKMGYGWQGVPEDKVFEERCEKVVWTNYHHTHTYRCHGCKWHGGWSPGWEDCDKHPEHWCDVPIQKNDRDPGTIEPDADCTSGFDTITYEDLPLMVPIGQIGCPDVNGDSLVDVEDLNYFDERTKNALKFDDCIDGTCTLDSTSYWKVSATVADESWKNLDFDDSGWMVALSPFFDAPEEAIENLDTATGLWMGLPTPVLTISRYNSGAAIAMSMIPDSIPLATSLAKHISWVWENELGKEPGTIKIFRGLVNADNHNEAIYTALDTVKGILEADGYTVELGGDDNTLEGIGGYDVAVIGDSVQGPCPVAKADGIQESDPRCKKTVYAEAAYTALEGFVSGGGIGIAIHDSFAEDNNVMRKVFGVYFKDRYFYEASTREHCTGGGGWTSPDCENIAQGEFKVTTQRMYDGTDVESFDSLIVPIDASHYVHIGVSLPIIKPGDENIMRAERTDTHGNPSLKVTLQTLNGELCDTCTRYFRKTINIPGSVTASSLKLTCDSSYELFINGQAIGSDTDFTNAEEYAHPGQYMLLSANPGLGTDGINVIAMQSGTEIHSTAVCAVDNTYTGNAYSLSACSDDDTCDATGGECYCCKSNCYNYYNNYNNAIVVKCYMEEFTQSGCALVGSASFVENVPVEPDLDVDGDHSITRTDRFIIRALASKPFDTVCAQLTGCADLDHSGRVKQADIDDFKSATGTEGTIIDTRLDPASGDSWFGCRGSEGSFRYKYDLTGEGCMDNGDLIALRSILETPSNCASPGEGACGDLNGDGAVTDDDITTFTSSIYGEFMWYICKGALAGEDFSALTIPLSSATDDASVDAASSDNLGMKKSLEVDHELSDGVGVALIRFNTDQFMRLAPPEKIGSVQLILKLSGSTSSGCVATNIDVVSIIGDWEELDVKGANMPELGTSVQTTTNVGCVPADNSLTDVSFDITTLFKNWINGAVRNNGLALRLEQTSGQMKQFISTDHETEDKRPRLLISFNTDQLSNPMDLSLDLTGDTCITNGDILAIEMLRDGAAGDAGLQASCASLPGPACGDMDGDGALRTQEDLNAFSDMLEWIDNLDRLSWYSRIGAETFNGALDANGDGYVSNGDWIALRNYVHTNEGEATVCATYDQSARGFTGCYDLNSDGTADGTDRAMFIAQVRRTPETWNQPPHTSAVGASPTFNGTLDLNGDGHITNGDWLAFIHYNGPDSTTCAEYKGCGDLDWNYRLGWSDISLLNSEHFSSCPADIKYGSCFGCPDIDGDGTVDAQDVATIEGRIGEPASDNPLLDRDRDGNIDQDDVACITNQLNTPPADIASCVLPAAVTIGAGIANETGCITNADWIALARFHAGSTAHPRRFSTCTACRLTSQRPDVTFVVTVGSSPPEPGLDGATISVEGDPDAPTFTLNALLGVPGTDRTPGADTNAQRFVAYDLPPSSAIQCNVTRTDGESFSPRAGRKASATLISNEGYGGPVADYLPMTCYGERNGCLHHRVMDLTDVSAFNHLDTEDTGSLLAPQCGISDHTLLMESGWGRFRVVCRVYDEDGSSLVQEFDVKVGKPTCETGAAAGVACRCFGIGSEAVCSAGDVCWHGTCESQSLLVEAGVPCTMDGGCIFTFDGTALIRCDKGKTAAVTDYPPEVTCKNACQPDTMEVGSICIDGADSDANVDFVADTCTYPGARCLDQQGRIGFCAPPAVQESSSTRNWGCNIDDDYVFLRNSVDTFAGGTAPETFMSRGTCLFRADERSDASACFSREACRAAVTFVTDTANEMTGTCTYPSPSTDFEVKRTPFIRGKWNIDDQNRAFETCSNRRYSFTHLYADQVARCRSDLTSVVVQDGPFPKLHFGPGLYGVPVKEGIILPDVPLTTDGMGTPGTAAKILSVTDNTISLSYASNSVTATVSGVAAGSVVDLAVYNPETAGYAYYAQVKASGTEVSFVIPLGDVLSDIYLADGRDDGGAAGFDFVSYEYDPARVDCFGHFRFGPENKAPDDDYLVVFGVGGRTEVAGANLLGFQFGRRTTLETDVAWINSDMNLILVGNERTNRYLSKYTPHTDLAGKDYLIQVVHDTTYNRDVVLVNGKDHANTLAAIERLVLNGCDIATGLAGVASDGTTVASDQIPDIERDLHAVFCPEVNSWDIVLDLSCPFDITDLEAAFGPNAVTVARFGVQSGMLDDTTWFDTSDSCYLKCLGGKLCEKDTYYDARMIQRILTDIAAGDCQTLKVNGVPRASTDVKLWQIERCEDDQCTLTSEHLICHDSDSCTGAKHRLDVNTTYRATFGFGGSQVTLGNVYLYFKDPDVVDPTAPSGFAHFLVEDASTQNTFPATDLADTARAFYREPYLGVCQAIEPTVVNEQTDAVSSMFIYHQIVNYDPAHGFMVNFRTKGDHLDNAQLRYWMKLLSDDEPCIPSSFHAVRFTTSNKPDVRVLPQVQERGITTKACNGTERCERVEVYMNERYNFTLDVGGGVMETRAGVLLAGPEAYDQVLGFTLEGDRANYGTVKYALLHTGGIGDPCAHIHDQSVQLVEVGEDVSRVQLGATAGNAIFLLWDMPSNNVQESQRIKVEYLVTSPTNATVTYASFDAKNCEKDPLYASTATDGPYGIRTVFSELPAIELSAINQGDVQICTGRGLGRCQGVELAKGEEYTLTAWVRSKGVGQDTELRFTTNSTRIGVECVGADQYLCQDVTSGVRYVDTFAGERQVAFNLTVGAFAGHLKLTLKNNLGMELMGAEEIVVRVVHGCTAGKIWCEEEAVCIDAPEMGGCDPGNLWVCDPTRNDGADCRCNTGVVAMDRGHKGSRGAMVYSPICVPSGAPLVNCASASDPACDAWVTAGLRASNDLSVCPQGCLYNQTCTETDHFEQGFTRAGDVDGQCRMSCKNTCVRVGSDFTAFEHFTYSELGSPQAKCDCACVKDCPLGLHCYIPEGEESGSCGRPQVRCPDPELPLYCEAVDACAQAVSDAVLITDEKSCACYGHFWCETSLEGQPCKQNPDECMSMLGDTTDDDLTLVTDTGTATGEQVVVYGDDSTFTIEVNNENTGLTAHYCVVPQVLVRPFECGYSWFSCDPLNWLTFTDSPVMAFVPPLGTDQARINLAVPQADAEDSAGKRKAAVGEYVVVFNVIKFIGTAPTGCDESALLEHEQCDDLENDFCARVLYAFSIPGTGGSCALGREFCGGDCYIRHEGTCCDGVWKPGWNCCTDADCEEVLGKKHFACVEGDVVRSCSEEECVPGYLLCGEYCKPDDPNVGLCCPANDGATVWREGAECCVDQNCTAGHVCQTWGTATYACTKDCTEYAGQGTHVGCGELCYMASAGACCEADWFESGVRRSCCPDGVTGYDACAGTHHSCSNNACQPDACEEGFGLCAAGCHINDGETSSGLCCSAALSEGETWIQLATCCGDDDCAGNYMCQDSRCSAGKCRTGLYIECGDQCIWDDDGLYACCDGEYFDTHSGTVPCCVGSEEQDCGGGNRCVDHACDFTACKEGYTYCGGECVDTRDNTQGLCCRAGEGDEKAWVWGDCCSGNDCPAEQGNFDCRVTAAGALFQTRQCTTTCGENLQGCGTSCVGLDRYAFGMCCSGAFIDGSECCREDDCAGSFRCRVDELVPTCAEDACVDGYTFCEGACWPRGTGACCKDQWLVGGTCCGDEDCSLDGRACIDNMCSTTKCASQYTPCGSLCIDELLTPGICCDGERWVESVGGMMPCCADEHCPGNLACGWDGYCETARCAAGSELCNDECQPLPGICCGDSWEQNGDCCSDLDCPGTQSCGDDKKCALSPCATDHVRCLGTCVPGECCPGDVNPITKMVCTSNNEWSASACAPSYLSCAGSCYRTSAGRCCIPANMWEVSWAEGEYIECCSDIDCPGGRPCLPNHQCAATCAEDHVECGGACRPADKGKCCTGVWKDGATCCSDDDCGDGMTCDPDVRACVSGSCAAGQTRCGAGCFDEAREVCCGEEVNEGACCGDGDCSGGFLCTHMFTCSSTECRAGHTYCDADKGCHGGKGVCCDDGFQVGGNCCSDNDCSALGPGFACTEHQCTVKGCPPGTVARGNTCAAPDEKGVICRSEWVPGGNCCSDEDCDSLHACIDNKCSLSVCSIGLSPCGDMCVDADRDPGACCAVDGGRTSEWIAGGNCCGNADCPGGLACDNGRCSEPQCRPGYINCGGACRQRSKGICCLDSEGRTAWNSGGNCCSNRDCTGGTTCDSETSICSTTDCDGGRGFTSCGLGCFDVPGTCCLGEWVEGGECCDTTDCDGLLGRENQRCDARLHACYSTECEDGYTFCSGACRDRVLGKCCDDAWVPRRTAGARACCADADCPGNHACDLEFNECNRKRCVAGFELCNNLCVQPQPSGSLCSEDCQCDTGLICSDKGTCVDERSLVQDCSAEGDCAHINKCITPRILAKGLCVDNGYGGKECAYEADSSEVYCPVHQMCGYEGGINTCVNLPTAGEFAVQLLSPLTDKLMVGDSSEVAIRAVDAAGDVPKDLEVSLEFGDRDPVPLLWINSKNSYVTDLDITDVRVGDHDLVITIKGRDVSKQLTKSVQIIGLFSLTSLTATPTWVSVGQNVLIDHVLKSTNDALDEGLLRWQFRINGEWATTVGDGHELTIQMPGSHEIEGCALANAPNWLPDPSCKKGGWCCRTVQVASYKGMLEFKGADGAPRNEFKVDEPVLITVSGQSGQVRCDAAGIDTSCTIEDATSCNIPTLTYSSPGIKTVTCTDAAGSTFKQQLTVLGELDAGSVELSVDLTSIKAGAEVSVVTAKDTKGARVENLEAMWTVLSNGTAVGAPVPGTINIPAEPGTYQLELKVSARPDYSPLIKRYEIVVPPHHEISLSFDSEVYAVMYDTSISFEVILRNEGNVAESLLLDVVCAGCPADTTVLDRHEAIVAPGEETVVPITVKGTAVGDYSIEVTAFNNDIDKSANFALTVSRDIISGLNLAFAEGPEHVVEVDEEYDLEVLVTNTGNAPDNFNVESEDLSFDKAYSIEPGQTRKVKIRVQTSEDWPFKIMAWPDADETLKRTIAGRLKVLRHEFEVTPLTLELEGTLGTKLPVQITVRNTGTVNEAIQVDYRGAGRLTLPSFISLAAEESRPVDGTYTVSGAGTGNLTLSLDGHPDVSHTVVTFIEVPVAFEVTSIPESYALMPGEWQTFAITVKGVLADEETQVVTVTVRESDGGILIDQKVIELNLVGDAVANAELNVSINPSVEAGEYTITLHVANDRGDATEVIIPMHVTEDALEMEELRLRLEALNSRISEYDASIMSLERQHITPISAMTSLDNAKVKLMQTTSSLRLNDAEAAKRQIAEIEALLAETDEDLQRASLLKDMKSEERTGMSPVGVLLALVLVGGGIGLAVRRQKQQKKAAWSKTQAYARQGQAQVGQTMMRRR